MLRVSKKGAISQYWIFNTMWSFSSNLQLKQSNEDVHIAYSCCNISVYSYFPRLLEKSNQILFVKPTVTITLPHWALQSVRSNRMSCDLLSTVVTWRRAHHIR